MLLFRNSAYWGAIGSNIWGDGKYKDSVSRYQEANGRCQGSAGRYQDSVGEYQDWIEGDQD